MNCTKLAAMVGWRVLAATVLLGAAMPVDACRDLVIAPEERAELADAIYVGTVTGVYLFQLEQYPEPIRPGQTHAPIGRVDRRVRVLVEETVKGPPESILELELDWCHGGAAEVGEYVAVYRLPLLQPTWQIRPLEELGR
jgi:hypothetical protein